MITIIAGTNRVGSYTLKLAKIYKAFLEEEKVEAQIFSLEEINMLQRNEAFEKLEEKYLLHSDKFILIAPEYNGSFPGILKLMIDMTDVKNVWHHKKICLTGVASGRAGNLRGLDVLTNMFHYMRMIVHPNKLPFSGIQNEIINDTLAIPSTEESIQEQIKMFVAF